MNKKFLSAILFGALMVTSTGTFVSCKDYDDDIDQINKELAEIKSQIEALQTAVDNGDYVTDVTKTADGKGMTFTFSKGSPVTVTLDVKDGEPGADAQKITFDAETGEMLIDNVPTGIFPTQDAEKAPVTIKDGYWAVLNEEGGYDATEIPVSGVTAVVTDGICKLTVFNVDGTTTVVDLPTTSSSITELEVLGYLDKKGEFVAFSGAGADDNKYEMDYAAYFAKEKESWKFTDGDGSQKVEGSIAKGTGVVSLEGKSLVIRVAPAAADLSTVAMSLVNSKLEEAPITLGAPEAYKGLVTRAASANGLWAIPLSSKEVADLSKLEDLTKQFGWTKEGANGNVNVAFAVKTPNFLSNYNLAFNKENLTAANAFLNDKALVKDAALTENAATGNWEGANYVNGNPAQAFTTLTIGEKNTFTFDVPTSIYMSEIIVDEYDKQSWGVTIDGNSFTVGKYNDKETIPSFLVYFNYVELTEDGIKPVQQRVRVRVERSIKDQVVLDAVNHIIPAKADDDKFSVSLDAMFTNMTAEERIEWNKFAKGAKTSVFMVDAAGDKDVTSIVDASGMKMVYADAQGNTTVDPTKLTSLNFALAHNWNQTDMPFDEEYYIVTDFTDENGDVLSSVKIPLTVGIPALSTLLQKEQVVFGGTNDGTGVLNEMDWATDNNAVFYTLKYAFKNQLADAFENSNIVFTLDADQKIGDDKVTDLVHMAQGTNPDRTGVNQAIVLNGKDKGNGIVKAYNTPINILIDAISLYVDKYTWSEEEREANAFTMKIVSPIERGTVEALNGDVIEVVATADGKAKLTDADLTTKTYAKVEYNVFKDKFSAETVTTADGWTSPYLKNVAFNSKNVNAIKEIKAADIKAATKANNVVTPGYVELNAMNAAYEDVTGVEVVVTDVWGYTKTATVNVKVLPEQK